MLRIGEYHTLIIDRETEPGLFLRPQPEDAEIEVETEEDTQDVAETELETQDEDETLEIQKGKSNINDILLPNKYIPESFKIGDTIDVFVYLDHQERPVATTLKPFIKLDEFAYLKCAEINNLGAFMEWGLEKHLFVPYREQLFEMRAGEYYLVFCYLDLETNRLVASTKVFSFTDNSEVFVEPFEEVDLIVANKTDLGYNVIINEIHEGLVFQSDVFQKLKPGDEMSGWVKKVRKDGKITVTLQRPGYRSIGPNSNKILRVLEVNNGFLPYHDRTDPDVIQKQLQMSKKSFKRAIGSLYKERQIDISIEGITLLNKSANKR